MQRHADDIVECFRRDGFVIVPQILDGAQCTAAIKEQVKEILLKQPWLRRLSVCDGDRVLDIDADTERYVAELTRPNIPKDTRAHYEDVWPLHAGFGACCDPQVFHLKEVWRIRQDPRLYEVACSLLPTKKLWVDINRSFQKRPGKGEEEFLHWDLPYLHDTHTDAECLSGKVMYTDGEFVCVPGTATAEFHAEFKAKYAPHYPNAKKNAAKFALDASKPDPMGLVAATRIIKVPAGSAIFWSRWLLHGVRRNPIAGNIQFGMYLGYMPAGSRRGYKLKCCVNEIEDRIRSFNEGVAPRLWASLDPIHYYPRRYKNFHRLLAPYIAKTRPGHPYLTTRTTKKGVVLSDLVPTPPTDYVKPVLDDLGERLLGVTPW
jgi:hypothetical protein